MLSLTRRLRVSCGLVVVLVFWGLTPLGVRAEDGPETQEGKQPDNVAKSEPKAEAGPTDPAPQEPRFREVSCGQSEKGLRSLLPYFTEVEIQEIPEEQRDALCRKLAGLEGQAQRRQLPELGTRELREIPAYVFAAAPPEELAGLNKRQLAALSRHQIYALSGEHLRAMSPDQLEVVDKGDEEVSAALMAARMRQAIAPGFYVFGSALGRLLSTSDSQRAEGGFGLGLGLKSPTHELELVFRRGTLSTARLSRADVGSAMLVPQTTAFSAGTKGFARVRYGRVRFGVGVDVQMGFLRTDVDVDSEEAGDGTPSDGMMGGEAPASEEDASFKRVDAIPVYGRLLFELSWLQAIERNAFMLAFRAGPTIRGLIVGSQSRPGAAEPLDRNDVRKGILGSGQRAYGGFDFEVEIRGNDFGLTMTLPIVASGDVPGLSGVAFVPTVSFRVGHRVVAF